MMNRGPSSPAFERPKARPVSVLRRLGERMARFLPTLIAACVLSVVGSLLALLSPRLSGAAIDAIVPGAVDFPVVLRLVIEMVVVALISSLLSWLMSIIMIRLSRKMVYQLRRDLFARLSTLPVSFFDAHQTGDVISVMSYDVDTVGASLSTDLTQLFSSLITVIGSFAMMMAISPRLLLVFVVTIPISMLFTRYRSKRVRPLFSKRSRMLGQLNGFVEEAVGGMKTIRAYHQEEEFRRRFRQHNDDAVEGNYNADYFASITGPSVNAISNLSLTMVSVFGSLMFMAGSITLGGVSAFVLYSRKFSGPINEFANLVSELQSALAAAERVLTLCDLPPETPDAADIHAADTCRGEVDCQHVTFGYTSDKQILTDICLHASPGQRIAIVGETGCGKTTLINLLMRFYDIDDGTILLDHTNIHQLTRSSLRRQFAMVLQDTWLFEGTIRENIAYGHPDATEESVISAAKAARIHDFILSLPQGYDTVITGEDGGISKGQKQLLTIARAFLLDASMLILDEATSNVDTQTERQIQQAMLTLMRNRTCFVIAHRLSTIADADQILVMSKGRIVEHGVHAELLAKNGLYADMFKAQFDIAG